MAEKVRRTDKGKKKEPKKEPVRRGDLGRPYPKHPDQPHDPGFHGDRGEQ